MAQGTRRILFRSIRLMVIALITFYLVLNLVLWWAAPRLLFFPPARQSALLSNELTLTRSDGRRLSALWLENPAAKVTVLFSHGNGEDLDSIHDFLLEIRDGATPANVLAYDYSGYGRSEGKPAEEETYRDIQTAWNWLTQTRKMAPSNIVVFGRSVGSGPSVWLAAREKPGGLILESAFSRPSQVVVGPLPMLFQPYHNYARLPRVNCPVLLLHGTRDELILPHHANMNFRRIRTLKKLHWVKGAGHNNVFYTDPHGYRRVLGEFLKGVERE
ncbi:MAG: alpha/beta hydrolase [Verrucomicrobiae bacterium]|nr:alpha/beta hydrolase [Verrucomicrobiae bacterium]